MEYRVVSNGQLPAEPQPDGAAGIDTQEQAPATPEPKAIGDSRVAVLSHSLTDVRLDPVDQARYPAAIEVALGNESGRTISTVILEAKFLDAEGSVLDTVRQKEVDLRRDGGRLVRIVSSEYRFDTVKSYDVRVVRTATCDSEPLQLRRHDMRKTDAGEEALRGIVKNVGETPRSAVVLATFFDSARETIGTRAAIVRGIEPGEVKTFDIVFKPQSGEVVSSLSLGVAEIAD